MATIDLTPAFLIHRRAFKDTSLLLDFFTRDYGKIRLVGRGVRRSKSPIQMFQKLNISYAGKGNLKTLRQHEVDDKPRRLRGDRLILGLYVNELISRLLPEQDPHPELFTMYQQFIQNLSTIEADASQWLLRLFETHLFCKQLIVFADSD